MPVAAPTERARLLAGLVGVASVVDRDAVDASIAVLVEERDADVAGRLAGLELALGDTIAELDEVTARRVRCDEDHGDLLRWADWCEAQPGEVVADAEAVTEATRRVGSTSVEAREASRALDDVLEQQATAEAALEEARLEVEARADTGMDESEVRHDLERAEQALARATEDGNEREAAEARRRIGVLRHTLAVRAEPRRHDGPHDEALAALSQQTVALEARLAEAVTSARSRADAALRALAQAEQVLERLHQHERGRHRRLRDAVAELPADLRPRELGDPLDHCEAIAEGLRTRADALRPDLEDLVATADRLSVRREELHREIDDVRAALGRVGADDVRGAVRALIDAAGPRAAVLDDPLTGEQWAPVLEDLAAHPPSGRVLLLTADSTVLDWAIDLPPSVGGVRTDAVGTEVAGGSESLQSGADPADAQGAGSATDAPAAVPAPSPGEPVVSIDRLRAFAFHPSPSRSPEEP